jgi:ADP-dependent phosphofructokinase/glucokinase
MKIICAYPINLDALHNVKGQELLLLCSRTRPEPRRSIYSMDDLCSSLLHCMQEGSGGELLIESQELARTIENSFRWSYRLGGNAGIMANVLATLGATPVLNAPSLSHRLAKMLNPQVNIPISGRLVEPLSAAGDEDMIHFVLQFAKGEIVATGMKEIVIPKDNRFIASFDPQNSRMASTPDFDSYCQREIESFDGALISGFHLAEFSEYKEIYGPRIEQIAYWKERQPKLYIHAEMGSFQRPEMMEYLLKRLPAESIGMNEDELAMLQKPDPGAGWKGIRDAVMDIRDKLFIPRLAVHTRDFIISASDGLLSAEGELRALSRGTESAGALAATGNVNGQPPLEINPAGQQVQREFCENGASVSGKGAYKLYGKTLVCLVPSLIAKRPRITVGLGDTATATIFYEEIKALKGIN